MTKAEFAEKAKEYNYTNIEELIKSADDMGLEYDKMPLVMQPKGDI